jgi:hypothetical protein
MMGSALRHLIADEALAIINHEPTRPNARDHDVMQLDESQWRGHENDPGVATPITK